MSCPPSSPRVRRLLRLFHHHPHPSGLGWGRKQKFHGNFVLKLEALFHRGGSPDCGGGGGGWRAQHPFPSARPATMWSLTPNPGAGGRLRLPGFPSCLWDGGAACRKASACLCSASPSGFSVLVRKHFPGARPHPGLRFLFLLQEDSGLPLA